MSNVLIAGFDTAMDNLSACYQGQVSNVVIAGLAGTGLVGKEQRQGRVWQG